MSISTTTTTDQFLSTPGEILKEEFLEPLGISNYRLAKTIGVGGNRNRRNRSRQANHQHGYGIPSGGSAWHHSGILDEPAARLRLAQIRHQYPRRYQTSDSRVSLRDNVMTRPLTIALLQISPDRHAGRQPGQRHPGLPPCRGTRRGTSHCSRRCGATGTRCTAGPSRTGRPRRLTWTATSSARSASWPAS